MSKGWLIRQTFDNRFINKLNDLYEVYGEEIFAIMGIANRHLDIAQFSKNFFGKSSNVAEVSIDGNANVREKNIMQYNYENGKALMKLNSLYMLWKWVMNLYDEDNANIALEKVINGELFVNDLTNYTMPYCYAFDLRVLISEGMNFFKGNMDIKPPKRSESFVALIIQSVAYISNQIMGAASFPDFFVILDWFYRKECGEDYIIKLKKELQEKPDSNKEIERILCNIVKLDYLIKEFEEQKKDTTYLKESLTDLHSFTEKLKIDLPIVYKVKNQFQNLIYSFNFPFRGNQSAFTNLSVMDTGFLKSLFKNYLIPEKDGTFSEPNLDSTLELSKIFFEYFSEINSKEGIFTFPVMTHAISLSDKGEYLDPDFVEWSAQTNCKKALANIFQSTPNSFSSCCRLKNDFSKVADVGYQNSFGVGGLSIGSHRVAGLNLPRIALLEKKHPKILEDDLEILHKILYSHRKLIEHLIDGGSLPLYPNGWISLKRQYSTIGFIGTYEYVINKGLDIRTEEGIHAVTNVLAMIEKKIVEWQEKEKDEKTNYNIEQIPGESMCVRLCEIDSLLGYNKKDWKLYSNQYIPLIEDAAIYDRCRIQGRIDKLTSGGAILHINVDDEKPLNAHQFRKIMDLARETGTVYFAINYAYSECEKHHYTIGKHETCPICKSMIICQYTRVVGFITPTKSWNKVRRDWEYERRVFYKNGKLEEVCKEDEPIYHEEMKETKEQLALAV